MAVDTLTDGVSDREVQFLCTGDGLGGNYESEIHFLPQAPATPGQKSHRVYSSVSRCRRRSKKIFRISARRVEKKEITLTAQRLDLAREHISKAEVVGSGRKGRRIGRERQGT